MSFLEGCFQFVERGLGLFFTCDRSVCCFLPYQRLWGQKKGLTYEPAHRQYLIQKAAYSKPKMKINNYMSVPTLINYQTQNGDEIYNL